MPLLLAPIGKEQIIRRVGGPPDLRSHLEDMGFAAGCRVMVLPVTGGNRIAMLKDARIAISQEMVDRILME